MDPDNDNSSTSGGGLDARVDPSPISSVHLKSLPELARLADHLPLQWAQLPQLPMFSPLLGYTDQWYRAAVALGVLETRWRGQRNLTDQEAQVVAHQTAKAIVTMSWELPAMLGTTYLYERNGRAAFRFPFYKPGPTFNPELFPTAQIALLRGPMARAAWHTLRATLYGALSHWVLRTLFVSYAVSVKSLEFERDPRLADIRGAIRQAIAARSTTRTNVWQGQPQQHQKQHQQPQGEVDDRQALPAQDRPQPPRRPGWLQRAPHSPPVSSNDDTNRASPPPQQTSFEDDSSSYDFDGLDNEGYHDDASPVAPTEQRKAWQRSASSRSNMGGGSAWDRVRTQTSSDGSSLAGPASRGSSWRNKGASASSPATTDRDYTFDEGTGEKSYTRDQAQKEFDAMLERERQGESDDRKRR